MIWVREDTHRIRYSGRTGGADMRAGRDNRQTYRFNEPQAQPLSELPVSGCEPGVRLRGAQQTGQT